ncbi:MAG TPA: phosphodiester glycosidase family protein [Planctomycetota bacterium]|nr:phosphodiester glycosidase family protein [Planctomycetota bacterium]
MPTHVICDVSHLASAARLLGAQNDAGDGVRETVNHLIDSLLSTFTRLLELPVLAVFAGIAVLALGLWAALAWLARRLQRPRLAKYARPACLVLAIVAATFAIDHRIQQLQLDLERVRERGDHAVAAVLENLARPGVRRSQPLVDAAAARAGLVEPFPSIVLEPLICNDAVDLVRIHCDDPLLEAFLAVVDLTAPAVQIEIGATLAHKTFTSDFARGHGCALAINGEAGNSPQPDCGFGPWRGHLMRRGETLLREEPGNARPFLAFDRDNRAHFVSTAAPDRSVPASAHDVIWGRVDTIVGGEVETDAFRFNQPRTVMGIDADGKRLFLLVADGRQPSRSWGLTRPQVGALLRPFGVRDAMLCDEGGSSCMYLREFGGLVNVPSDGQERPTYTHFGIVLRD